MSTGSAGQSKISILVAQKLRDVPDFPKPGVLFKDFTPLLADPHGLAAVVEDVRSRYAGRVDVVVGIEARGFILGAAAAHALGVGFVPVRKAGKLPGRTHRAEYTLEYGTAVLELHVDAFVTGHRVLIMDDVLATGGTVSGAVALLRRAGAVVDVVSVVLELEALGGRARLRTELPGGPVAVSTISVG